MRSVLNTFLQNVLPDDENLTATLNNRSNYLRIPAKNPVAYYTAGIEQFSLKIDHNAAALSFIQSDRTSDRLSGSNTEMEGLVKKVHLPYNNNCHQN
jgi:hypothetical protein